MIIVTNSITLAILFLRDT